MDDLAEGLAIRLGVHVLPKYNEFCAPTVDEAIQSVIDDGANTVFVLPTMLLQGSSHTESEIRTAVSEARRKHPEGRVEYAWPFSQERMVSLFAGQVRERMGGDG